MKLVFNFLMIALSLTTCTKDKIGSPGAGTATAQQTSSKAAPAEGPITEMSVYNLESEWRAQTGEVISLPELKGKVQVMTMIYTSCTYACPRIMADLKHIETSLSRYKRDAVGFILVSMDTETDTPEKLKEFASAKNLDNDRWLLLTGKEADIQELALLLKVKYKKSPEGDLAHSNIITVLDPKGEIVHQQQGQGVEPDETVKAIENLLQHF